MELRTKGQEEKELGEKKRVLCCCLHSESKHDAREFNSIVPFCCCASQNTWPSLHCPASTSSHFPQTILFTEMREIYNIVTSYSKRWNENGYSDWRLLEFSSVSPEKRFHGNLKWIQWIPSRSLLLYVQCSYCSPLFCFLDRAFSKWKTKINQQNAQINSGLIYYWSITPICFGPSVEAIIREFEILESYKAILLI